MLTELFLSRRSQGTTAIQIVRVENLVEVRVLNALFAHTPAASPRTARRERAPNFMVEVVGYDLYSGLPFSFSRLLVKKSFDAELNFFYTFSIRPDILHQL
jgi:hypothetical protein